MASDEFLVVLALLIVVVTFAASMVGLLFSLPHALRRLRYYLHPGSRRAYARKRVFETSAPLVCVMCALLGSAALAFMPDTDLRAIISRLAFFAALLAPSIQILYSPILESKVERLSRREQEGQSVERKYRGGT